MVLFKIEGVTHQTSDIGLPDVNMQDRAQLLASKDILQSKYGIDLHVSASGVFIGGVFFKDRALLKSFAPKLDYVLNLAHKPGKMLVFNSDVHNVMGILTIREMMIENGFAELDLQSGAVKNDTA